MNLIMFRRILTCSDFTKKGPGLFGGVTVSSLIFSLAFLLFLDPAPNPAGQSFTLT